MCPGRWPVRSLSFLFRCVGLDEGEDLLLALARSLTERVEASEDSLEGLFAGVRQTE